MESKAASIEIKILDVEGKPVERPAILDLQTSYIFQVTVTNQTETRGGKPWEALLEVGIGVSLDGLDIVPYSIGIRKFAPSQSVGFIPHIYTQSAYAGMTGRVIAKVTDPFGRTLASATERFKIGYEVSPYAVYQPLVSELDGIDMPYLNPALELTEDEVVMGGVGSKPPSRPPAPPSPKVVPQRPKEKVMSDLDLTSIPEPKVGFVGETAFGGRLG